MMRCILRYLLCGLAFLAEEITEAFLESHSVMVCKHSLIRDCSAGLRVQVSENVGSFIILECSAIHSCQSAHGKYLILELIPMACSAC